MDPSLLLAAIRFYLLVGLVLTIFVWFLTKRFHFWIIIGWPILVFALFVG